MSLAVACFVRNRAFSADTADLGEVG